MRRTRFKTPDQSSEAAHVEASKRAAEAEAMDRAELNALGPLSKGKKVRFRRHNQMINYEVESEAESSSGTEVFKLDQPLPPFCPQTQQSIETPLENQADDAHTSPTETSSPPNTGVITSKGQDLVISAVAIDPNVETRSPEALVAFEFRATCRWGTAVVFGLGFLAGAFTIIAFIVFLSFSSPYTCHISLAVTQAPRSSPMLSGA
jgi:hypothetical protein